MKKILLIAALAVCSLTVSAQRASSSSSSFFSTEKADGGVKFGIRAGLNISNMTLSEDNMSISSDSRTAFHVGVIADIPLMQSLYIQPGLFLQNKGFKEEEDGETLTGKPMYLEIPVLASYRYNFSDAVQMQINVGPYFAYGLGGKVKYESDGKSYEEDFFGSYDDDSFGCKRFDCGLQFGAGLTFASHYYIGFAYQLGLTNIADLPSGYDGDYSAKNKNWMISLGYNF